jgi:hypothetical protein
MTADSIKRFFYQNGLSIVLSGFFLFSLIGQFFTGYEQYNDDRIEHSEPAISHTEYVKSGHFIEAVFENWESEFLQMGMYVVLTVFLYQKGSSESKEPGIIERVDVIPGKESLDKDAPLPVKRGGWRLKIYENSLGIALFLLFAASFVLHAYGGMLVFNEEQKQHGKSEQVSTIGYMETSRFWFESFQNWQSEFLSIGAMIVLTIFLRQKGSPESKPVDSPYKETGQ